LHASLSGRIARHRGAGLPDQGDGQPQRRGSRDGSVCGARFFSPDIAEIIVNRFVKGAALRQTPGGPNALTVQERKILQLVAEGLTYKDIAVRLNLSNNTVHTHRKNLMSKLNIHRQADLVRYAIKEGIAKL